MKKALRLLILFTVAYTATAQTGWKQNIRDYTTIDNITYYFPEGTDIVLRESLIALCRDSIIENSTILGVPVFTNPMDIEFLANREEMRKYAGAPVQGMAMFNHNKFYALLKDDKSLIKHELMHMQVKYAWGNADNWIDEGLATYSGGICMDYSFEEIYAYFIQSNKLVPMDKLVTDFFGNPNDLITYTQSAYLVQYLIENYGIGKFKMLWQQGFANFENIYGFTFDNFQQTLASSSKAKYPNGVSFDWDTFNKGC